MEIELELTGSVRSLFLFDIGESIDLSHVHSLLGSRPARREPAFRHPAPEYVRFERPPVTEQLGLHTLDDTEEIEVRVRYFDYGVASVELLKRFRTGWVELTSLANRWMTSLDLEPWAEDQLRKSLKRTGSAVQNPNENWLSEDYCIVQIDPIIRGEQNVTAEDLIGEHGAQIAQIVRGELNVLSSTERDEVLRSTMSYYPTDLLVLGWVGAVVYDAPEAAGPTVELLEYANTQLLEFRYYDEVLTRVLSDAYKRLEKRQTMWGRWNAAREAGSLNTIRLDYQELVERTDNAIKFLSDMFYARMYKLAAKRIGVTDYLALVNEKLNTARDLYESMVNEFHQGRAFFLELLVVIILMIEIVFLFVGKVR